MGISNRQRTFFVATSLFVMDWPDGVLAICGFILATVAFFEWKYYMDPNQQVRQFHNFSPKEKRLPAYAVFKKATCNKLRLSQIASITRASVPFCNWKFHRYGLAGAMEWDFNEKTWYYQQRHGHTWALVRHILQVRFINNNLKKSICISWDNDVPKPIESCLIFAVVLLQ